jgi:hypothetical protein
MEYSNFLRRVVLTIGLAYSAMLSAETVPLPIYSIEFGTAMDLAPACTKVGPAADRDCSRSIAIDNGPSDRSAKFSVRAQASADTGSSSGSLIASASIDVNYQVPFTVTRQVDIVAVGGQYLAVAPELSLDLSYLYGAVAATKNEAGTGKERADVGELTVTLTDATPWTVGARGQSGGSGINRNVAKGDTTRSITLSTGASVGEVGSIADIPLSFNSWNDESPPFVDYAVNNSFEQIYAGIVGVQVTLVARSEADPSCIGFLCELGNGGEAIACFGVGSGLGGFDLDVAGCPVGFSLDLDPVEDGGLDISGSLAQTATAITRIGPVVPVPAAVWLFGSGLIGLLGVARRKKS